MSAFNHKPASRAANLNRRPALAGPGNNPSKSGPDLFPIAVMIMGIVSCYTTAVGLFPMLGNWILSYATAFALSVFMVAIALRMPKAYREGTQGKLIAGYIFVALFSVLLNFNAIYGVFSAEKLLYEELKNNKMELTAIRTRSVEALDSHFGAVETEQQLQQARALLKEETTNRVVPGYGKNARKINQEQVIPLQAKLAAIRVKYDPTVAQIDSVVAEAQLVINKALQAKEIPMYREAVDLALDAYSQVGEMTQNLIGKENFTYQPLVFQHRDVGNLNHSLWTIANLPKFEAKQVSSIIVSLLLSLLIDFIVLFVIVMVNRPGKGDLNDEESENTGDESLPWENSEYAPVHTAVYAKRRNRNTANGSSAHRIEIQRVDWNKSEAPVVAPVVATPTVEETPAEEETSQDMDPVLLISTETPVEDSTIEEATAEEISEPEVSAQEVEEDSTEEVPDSEIVAETEAESEEKNQAEEAFPSFQSEPVDPPTWYLPEEGEEMAEITHKNGHTHEKVNGEKVHI